jgi:hypothetical protein
MDQPIGRLGVFALDCPDPATLAAFYQVVVGGDIVVHESGDWIELRTRNGTLAFQQIVDHRPPTWPNGDVPQQAHLDVDVDDLDGGEARVLELGAIKTATQPSPADFRVFLDPAGHPFCLVLAEADDPPQS